MFCFHKYMAAEGNVQSCYKCGSTRIIKCTSHTLEDKGSHVITITKRRDGLDVKVRHDIMHQRCIRCGRYFNYDLTEGKYEGDKP